MPTTIPHPAADDLRAQVASLVARVETLEGGQDALDRGVLEAGMTACRALAEAEEVGRGLRSAYSAAGLNPESDEATSSFGDPVSAWLQVRRRRIERSGLRLIPGGAA